LALIDESWGGNANAVQRWRDPSSFHMRPPRLVISRPTRTRKS
jgi:hypothetical protein